MVRLRTEGREEPVGRAWRGRREAGCGVQAQGIACSRYTQTRSSEPCLGLARAQGCERAGQVPGSAGTVRPPGRRTRASRSGWGRQERPGACRGPAPGGWALRPRPKAHWKERTSSHSGSRLAAGPARRALGG